MLWHDSTSYPYVSNSSGKPGLIVSNGNKAVIEWRRTVLDFHIVGGFVLCLQRTEMTVGKVKKHGVQYTNVLYGSGTSVDNVNQHGVHYYCNALYESQLPGVTYRYVHQQTCGWELGLHAARMSIRAVVNPLVSVDVVRRALWVYSLYIYRRRR